MIEMDHEVSSVLEGDGGSSSRLGGKVIRACAVR